MLIRIEQNSEISSSVFFNCNIAAFIYLRRRSLSDCAFIENQHTAGSAPAIGIYAAKINLFNFIGYGLYDLYNIFTIFFHGYRKFAGSFYGADTNCIFKYLFGRTVFLHVISNAIGYAYTVII